MPDVLGLVPLLGRGPLAWQPFKGRALFVSAADALTRVANPPVMALTDELQTEHVRAALAGCSAVVDLVECPRDEDRLQTAARVADVVLVHDPLCPLVSAASLRRVLQAWERETAVVAVRPIVDTLKAAADGVVAGPVDREQLRIISSPVVMPAALLHDMPDVSTSLGDLSVLVQWLRSRCDVVLSPAPSASRRIEDVSSMHLVSSVDAVGHRLRER